MPESEAHPRKIRFGAYELDEAARELRKNGLSIHLQDQPWEVLRALLERPGEVVSREELRRRLWPDGTYVDYEQSLNKAVNKLREALCDSADKPRYVETVSRRGYRFVAAVEAESPRTELPQEKPIEISKPARSSGRHWWDATAISLVVAGTLVTGLWPVGEITARVTPLTNGGTVLSDRLAVHDGRILYLTGAKRPYGFGSEIWSISADGGDQRREALSFLGAGDDVWFTQVNSRQGAILIASHPPGITRGILWLADFVRSKPRQIGEWIEDYSYGVSPDFKTLLRSAKDGLFVRPTDGGPETAVVRSDWNARYLFFWHPSGERIGFVPVKGGVASVWEVKPDGSGMRPLLPEFPGAQLAANWSPDGRRLYFVSQGEIYRRGRRGWLGWMRRPKPERLTTGSTMYGLAFEDPADSHLIYSRGRVSRGELMKLNQHTNRFERYLDGLSAEWLAYSPDGQWIAYVSFPRGELWKCRRDGSGKVLLDDSLVSQHPRWSPDGTRLAFAGIRRGTIETYRIYTIGAEGGKAEPVKGVKGFGHDPHWSPDGKRLVFSPIDYPLIDKQDRHISIVNVETGEVQMVPGSEDICCQSWSPDGKRLAAITWSPEHLVAYDFETKQWTVVNDKAVGYCAWSKDSKYLYGMMEAQILVRIELAARKVEEIRRIDDFRLTGGLFGGPSWTPELEPVILADKSTNEIFRIEVER